MSFDTENNPWKRIMEENRELKLQIDKLKEKEILAPQMRELEKDFLLFALQSDTGRKMLHRMIDSVSQRYSPLLKETIAQSIAQWEAITK